LRIAEASDGCFDPTIAPQLVSWGFLPRPSTTIDPDARADWRDIELVGNSHVRLAQPLWLDLGGIAKGYAVDRAVEVLLEAGTKQVVVEAGGDLRVAGTGAETVYLRDGAGGVDASPLAEISDAAFATSCGAVGRRRIDDRWCSVHVDARTREPSETTAHACVTAPTCMVADALTKVLLAADTKLSQRVLARFGAEGRLFRRPMLEAAA
jgi:thiamine biosynthesis lipoprotein